MVMALAGVLTGCASVKMESAEATAKAQEFAAPAKGQSGLYVYRSMGPGTALKKDIFVDGKCLGESAPKVFFYTQVEGDKEHILETESEFSNNSLKMMFEAGKNYFVRQYIKLGVFVGGANLEQVDEAKGKEAVRELKMATPGNCSK